MPVTDLIEVKLFVENAKTFSSLLHYLSRIGKYIVIEVERNRMCMRALNDGKSAFSVVQLDPHFFEYIRVIGNLDDDNFACKVPSKALCAVVKNLKGLASICFKAIIEDSVNKLIFEMVNVNGIKRIHKFSYQDTAVVDSVVDESSYSYVRSEPKIFAQAFEHLHLSPEILLLVSNDTFQLRSFNQKEITIGNKINKNSVQGHLSTELSLDINEFDDYVYVNVGNETEENKQQSLVLLVKEFRAFLGLCEVLDSPDFVFYFYQPTYPVKLCCSIAGSVNVSLVLATLQIGRNFSNAPTTTADTSHVGDNTESHMDVDYAAREEEEEEEMAGAQGNGTQESRTEAVNTLLSIGTAKLVGARGINAKREPKYYGTNDDDDDEEEL